MSLKKVIIFVVVACLVGIIFGGISKIFDIDFGMWLYAIIPGLFIIMTGIDQTTSKKKDDSIKKNKK